MGQPSNSDSDPGSALRGAVLLARRKRELRDRLVDRRIRQRDMGLGYLIYCARRTADLSISEIAKRAGFNRSDVSRWENRARVPSLHHLQRIAEEADCDFLVGLRSRITGETVVLGALDDEGPMVTLELIVDGFDHDPLPQTRWRKRAVEEGKLHPEFGAALGATESRAGSLRGRGRRRTRPRTQP